MEKTSPTFWRVFWLGALLTAAPFLFTLATRTTFAPIDSLYATNIPYHSNDSVIPNNYFWSDTVNFYWPRLYSLARREVPISFSSGGGGPLYTDSISGFYNPVNLIVFLGLPVGNYSLELMWLLQFLLLYSGLMLWLSSLSLSPVAALTGALSHVYCTAYFPGSYMSFQTLGAMMFLPWALFFETKTFLPRFTKYLGPVFLGLAIISGNIQTAVYPILVYSLWLVLQKRFLRLIEAGVLSLLFTLPYWLESIQYHIVLNVHSLAQRNSEIPLSTWGKFKTLFALISLVMPELFGSSKTIDLLKIFETSKTYFIGSVGLIGPLFVYYQTKQLGLRNRKIIFPLVLVIISLVIMTTPLLSFFYYRVLCLICFSFSILLAISVDSFNKPAVPKRILVISPVFIVIACIVHFATAKFSLQIHNFLEPKIMRSAYSWWEGMGTHRISALIQDYLFNLRFLAMSFILPIFYLASKNRKPLLIVCLILVDILLIWCDQVSINQQKDPTHPAYIILNNELKKSPAYPLSRYMVGPCGAGKYFFNFIINEYQGVPSSRIYGSTSIKRLEEPSTLCDSSQNTLTFSPLDLLDYSAINVVVTRANWRILDKRFSIFYSDPEFIFWSKKPSPAILRTSPSAKDADVPSSTISWSNSSLSLAINPTKIESSWLLSLPSYPGWKYFLNGKEIVPTSLSHNLPVFSEPLNPGQHYELTAKFQPLMFYWGLIGFFFGVIFILWKSTLIRD